MFRKKIVPDYTKRDVTQQPPIKYTAPVQTPEALPERIMISKPLPLVVPPPPPPMVYPKVVRQEVQAIAPVSVMFSTPLGDPLPIPNSSFSPNLETFPTLGTSYFGGAGGSAASNWALYPAVQNVDLSGFSIFNCSNISANFLNVSTLSSQTAFISSIGANSISTNTLFAKVGFISTISTQAVVLDGNELSTAGNELLFNGQPIATVSTISTNVASWALYPALSTILADNNNITGVGNIQLSTINGIPFTTPSSITTWSQFPATSQVDFAQYNLTNVSTINGAAYIAGGGASAWSGFPATQTVEMANNSLNHVAGVSLSTINSEVLLTAGAGNVLNVNGVPVATGGGASTWANFPAISTVTILDHDLSMQTTTPGVSYKNANINANVVIGNTSQAPLRPDLTAYCGAVSLGGLANPLTSMNIYSLGSVGINSLSGISVSGGGGVAISGAGGVAVTGAGALTLNGGNVEIAGAGGVLVNGTGAITVTSGGVFVNGGGVSIAAGGVAITAGGLSIAGGAVTIGTLGVAGGNLTIYGGDLNMATVTGGTPNAIKTDRLESVGTNTLAISGVSTINGLPYSTGSSTAFSYNLYVSNISGSDTTGDGKISNPFQTITRALTVAGGIPDTNKVSIFLASGTYTENINVTRANTFISGSATSLSTATLINGSVTIDMTASTQPFIIGGLSSVQVSNIIHNNSVGNSQSYLITDCLITPGAGVSAIVATDTSSGAGFGDVTIQSCLIYMSNAIAVTTSNVYISFINTEIKNNPLVISPLTMIQTTGSGRLIMLNCAVTQASTVSTVAPIINLANTSTTSFMSISNSVIQYSSATSDAGTGGKCCVRCANSGAITSLILFNNLLLCQGATTTNGTAGQFVVLQRTGAGAVTLNHGQNSGGTTANHLPANGGGFTKTAYVSIA